MLSNFLLWVVDFSFPNPFERNNKKSKMVNSRAWWGVYQLKIAQESEVDNELEVVQSLVPIDFAFYSRLRQLEKVAIILQYQFACLSTLGGAYHLCNRPKVALLIAKRQEQLGQFLGSTQIMIRALVFQAINYRLLGSFHKSDKIFKKIKTEYDMSTFEESKKFMDACEGWARRNIIDAPPNTRQL